MHIFFNEKSLHGQFRTLTEFADAFGKIMAMREVARKHSRAIKIHRRFDDVVIIDGQTLQEILGRMDKNKRAAILAWKTKEGPIWEDDAQHGPDDYFACKDQIVTDTAVAEAASCQAMGDKACLVSVTPSDWQESPIVVRWEREPPQEIELPNFWDLPPFARFLDASPRVPLSWRDVEELARTSYPRLRFTEECFDRLHSLPFGDGPAGEIMRRFHVLQQLLEHTLEDGRTEEGNRLYQDHFVGCKAWFSDSSDTEKDDFRTEMTFRHPDTGEKIFCPMHGKVKSPQIRIHFHWPPRHDERLIVAYVGMKITRY